MSTSETGCEIGPLEARTGGRRRSSPRDARSSAERETPKFSADAFSDPASRRPGERIWGWGSPVRCKRPLHHRPPRFGPAISLVTDQASDELLRDSRSVDSPSTSAWAFELCQLREGMARQRERPGTLRSQAVHEANTSCLSYLAALARRFSSTAMSAFWTTGEAASEETHQSWWAARVAPT